eukprot:838804-Amphidinium_carterae.2
MSLWNRLELDDAAEPAPHTGASTRSPGGTALVQTPGLMSWMTPTSCNLTLDRADSAVGLRATASTTVRSLDHTRSVASKRDDLSGSYWDNSPPILEACSSSAVS